MAAKLSKTLTVSRIVEGISTEQNETRPQATPAQLGLLIGCCAAIVTLVVRRLTRSQTSDFVPVWLGARALLQGHNPYQLIDSMWQQPLLYPLSAVILSIPIAWLPLAVATPIFVGVGAGLFGYAVVNTLPVRPARVVFFSGSFISAVAVAQWSPLLTASALIPTLGWILACKPTTAIWLFAWRPKYSILTAVLGLLICIAASPRWMLDWWRIAHGAAYPTVLALLPGGPILLAAWWSWRDPDARLIGTLAVVPHSTFVYEALPVMLIARTWREGWTLAIGSWIAWLGHHAGEPYTSQAAAIRSGGSWLLYAVYVPALIMVLRRPSGERPTSPSSVA